MDLPVHSSVRGGAQAPLMPMFVGCEPSRLVWCTKAWLSYCVFLFLGPFWPIQSSETLICRLFTLSHTFSSLCTLLDSFSFVSVVFPRIHTFLTLFGPFWSKWPFFHRFSRFFPKSAILAQIEWNCPGVVPVIVISGPWGSPHMHTARVSSEWYYIYFIRKRFYSFYLDLRFLRV